MKSGKRLCRGMVCVLAVLIMGNGNVWAQKAAVPPRVVETVDDTRTVQLPGNVHPLAKSAYDQGAVADSQPMTRMMLLLQRSAGQELALRQVLDAQQTKGSGGYHAWLTPAQFGSQYGPSDADVQAVTDWLTREGFQVKKVAAGKTVVEFDGNAGQVRNSFHTEIHKFVVNGEEHFANVSDPAIPEALAPVVAGPVALHNFRKHSYIRNNGLYRRTKGSSELQPLFTYGSPVHYAMGPGDFATIYGIPSTATGAGQAIAIIAQTNINTQDVVNFRSMFGLPAFSSVCTSGLPPSCQFSVIINGNDPGILGPNTFNCVGDPAGDEVEADTDSEWAGGIAPDANIYLVVSETTCTNPTQVSQGVDLSAVYAVDNNLAPVISYSYGACESGLLTAGNQFYSLLWEQAAAQGITVAVAAGDTGPAGCDPYADDPDPNAANQGIAVSGTASTPYNVAVGGTDFDPSTTGNATYWSPNTNGDVINSALKYIPETTWDESACALAYPAACTSVDTTFGTDLAAGSGGPSNCILGTENTNTEVITCSTGSPSFNGGYVKPPFQQSGITPADGVRDIPDVSFFASDGGPLVGGADVAYVICQSDTNPQDSTTPTGASCNITTPYEDFSVVGGTSVSTPAFAAVMALVNQSTGQRQGNANYVLYNLATSDANYTGGKCASSVGQTPAAGCVFNDVTKGNNAVACDAGSPNCSNTADTAGAYGVLICNTTSTQNGGITCPLVDNGTPAFVSGAAYDLATGLGSINVGNLLTKWTAAIRTGTTTTLVGATGGSPSGTAFSVTVNVTGGATGDVSLTALANDQATVLGSFGPYTLAAGTASANTTLLPPSTAYVEATYGGDATHAASTSAPVALAVTGAGQSSTTTVGISSFNSNGTWSTPVTSSQNFVYGSAGYFLNITVKGSSGSCSFSYPKTTPATAIPCPTGTITLTDNGSPLTDFLNKGTATNVTTLNNNGLVEDQPINVNVGSHSIVAAYGGDPNYNPSMSNTLSMTLTQATPLGVDVFASPGSGNNVTFTAYVVTSSTGNGPTGTMAFTNGGTSIGSANCVPTSGTADTTSPESDIQAGTAYCMATLTASISALYPPPGNGPRTPEIPVIPIVVALFSLALFALGWKWMPQPRRRAYAYAGLVAFALLAAGIAGCGGGGSSGTVTRTITASYPGDVNYKSASGNIQVTVP
jgi:hypothetical protein